MSKRDFFDSRGISKCRAFPADIHQWGVQAHTRPDMGLREGPLYQDQKGQVKR